MSEIYNILIIDDHPLVRDAFENAFNLVSSDDKHLSFKIDKAQNCEEAFDKITISENTLDLVVLDISLPSSTNAKIKSGEDLGLVLKEVSPSTKVLVCTSFTDNYRLVHILKSFDPIGFINKQDIGFKGFVSAIKNVLSNNTYYSQTIIDVIKNISLSKVTLDDFDILILRELSNGSKMRDLMELVPLTKSGIVKRKNLLKRKLSIHSNSDRDLVLTARRIGFI